MGRFESTKCVFENWSSVQCIILPKMANFKCMARQKLSVKCSDFLALDLFKATTEHTKKGKIQLTHWPEGTPGARLPGFVLGNGKASLMDVSVLVTITCAHPLLQHFDRNTFCKHRVYSVIICLLFFSGSGVFD